MTGAVAVFGSSKTREDTTEWKTAEEVGRKLALSGLALVTGGYAGTMEAASKGASEAQGHVIGVTAPTLFPGRTGANRYVAELIEARDLADRIGTMLAMARGVIALPGSVGTATELLIAWNHNHIVRLNGGRWLPAVAVGERWKVVANTIVDQIGGVPRDIHLADTPDEALGWLLDAI